MSTEQLHYIPEHHPLFRAAKELDAAYRSLDLDVDNSGFEESALGAIGMPDTQTALDFMNWVHDSPSYGKRPGTFDFLRVGIHLGWLARGIREADPCGRMNTDE